jgi:hypothetical protein
VNGPDGWLCHVLRREAEGLILPNLAALLDGSCQPQDNDERLALFGVCQFTNRHVTLARLYADAVAAEHGPAEDVTVAARYLTARVATQAGLGQGKDADQLPDNERAFWRRQALDWLRQDLTAWGNRLDNRKAQTNAQVRLSLQRWQRDPDLVGVRAKESLAKLPKEEQRGGSGSGPTWARCSSALACRIEFSAYATGALKRRATRTAGSTTSTAARLSDWCSRTWLA